MLSSSSRRIAALVLPIGLVLAACGDVSDDAEKADDTPAESVSFTTPADGAQLAGGVKVEMAAKGLTIEPAGDVHDHAGHFHVIADDGCVAPGTAVPKDADHVHFGKGQTTGTIYLEPGTHELCLQAGDGAHLALDLTDRVNVNVGITDESQWCAVAKESDALALSAGAQANDFATKKAMFESVRRLDAQLLGGLTQVDAEARGDVEDTVQSIQELAAAYAGAADQAAADAALAALQQSGDLAKTPQDGQWVRDTCGVDLLD